MWAHMAVITKKENKKVEKLKIFLIDLSYVKMLNQIVINGT